ncbi:MAG: DUF1778 domain-containing protein [gamma proteobacterium symbiont of Bathyaustriella thionipta]|nr:DUF1778 domain-containing protein [gamma proteobacterium symbiont of Bathyaustriella thionipta]
MSTPQNKIAPINIRAQESQRTLIDKAASRLNKTRSNFMLEAACQAAENILLDQRLFLLNDETFSAFQAQLDAPVLENKKLSFLLHQKSPWNNEPDD